MLNLLKIRSIRVLYWFTRTRRRKILSLTLISLITLTTIRFIFVKPKEVKADSLFGFNEGYGSTVNDENGNASGTITGATWKTEDLCFSGKCLYFDGSDWLSFGDDADFDFAAATDFTIQFWFRHPSASAAEVIIQKYEGAGADGGYRIRMESDGDISFGVDDANGGFADDNITSTAATYDDNRWHHISAVKDGTTGIYLYIDGVLVASDTTIGSTGTLANDDTLYIGDSDGVDNADEYIGFLDEVKIYTTSARSSAEVKSDIAGSTPNRGTAASFGDTDTFLSDGLVGYWKMDETSGNASDTSGNTTTLTNAGTAAFVGAKFGNGITLNGTSQYFYATDNSALSVTGDLTVSAWVNPTSLSNNNDIVAKWDGANRSYLLTQLSTGAIRFALNGTANYIQTGSGAVATGNYYLVTANYHAESQTAKLFINGSQVSTTTTGTIPSTINDNASNFQIGAEDSSSTPSNYYNGKIDDVRIYNRTLSPAEVSQLYNWAPGPVGWWKMDEGSGTVAKDYSGYDNSTTTVSGTAPTWTQGKYGKGLDFSGSGYLYRASTSSLDFEGTNNFSFSVWVYPRLTGGGTYPRVFRKERYVSCTDVGGYMLQIANNGTATFEIRNNSCSSTLTTSVTANQWVHLAGVYDGTNMYFYKNGVFVSSRAQGGIGTHPSANFELGGSNNFNGKIDDLKVYNYARTPGQIIEDMNAGHPAPGSPVGSAVAHWEFDEGYGTTANDSSNNSNSLTLSSASWTNSGKFGKAWNGTGALWLSRADDADFDFSATEDLTASIWFKSDSASNPGAIEYLLNKANATTAGYAVYANTSGQICFGIDDDTTWNPDIASCTTTDYYDGTWHHATAIRNVTADETRIFIDGVSKDNDSDTTTATLANSLSLYLGDRDGTDNGDEFNGDIDETKIFRSALTADQVKVLYNQSGSTVFGATSTDSSGNPTWSTERAYCFPGDTTSTCSPVGEWRMDEKTGTGTDAVKDTSGNNNHGDMEASMTNSNWVRGKYGAAMDFDGVNDYVNAGDVNQIDGVTAMTVTAWAKWEATPGSLNLEREFVRKNNVFAFGSGWDTPREGKGRFWINDGAWFNSGDGTTSLDDGNWHYIAGVYDGTFIRLYVDGIQEVSNNVGSKTLSSNTNSLYIGSFDGTDEFWDGIIDQVRLYNYARTPAQIAWDYNRGGPVGWWKFDECTGATAYDSSGKGNNGTIYPVSLDNTSVGTCGSGTATEMWNDGTNGKRNASIGLDGSDDYVEIPKTGMSTDVGTVSLWFNRQGSGSWVGTDRNYIFSQPSIGGDNSRIYLSFASSTSTTLQACLGDCTTWDNIGSYTVTNATWNQAVVTWQGTTGKLYVNGQLIATQTFIGLSNFCCSNFLGSWRGDGNLQLLNGYIDEVKIFNYALTAQQVRDVYNNGVVRFGQ